MRIKLLLHPLFKSILLSLIFSFSCLTPLSANAEVIDIPIQRSVATQPMTKLEIISIVKSLLSGRILSIKKQSSYTNPDCYHVKFLEDKGEFQLIKLGCYKKDIIQSQL